MAPRVEMRNAMRRKTRVRMNWCWKADSAGSGLQRGIECVREYFAAMHVGWPPVDEVGDEIDQQCNDAACDIGA